MLRGHLLAGSKTPLPDLQHELLRDRLKQIFSPCHAPFPYKLKYMFVFTGNINWLLSFFNNGAKKNTDFFTIDQENTGEHNSNILLLSTFHFTESNPAGYAASVCLRLPGNGHEIVAPGPATGQNRVYPAPPVRGLKYTIPREAVFMAVNDGTRQHGKTTCIWYHTIRGKTGRNAGCRSTRYCRSRKRRK